MRSDKTVCKALGIPSWLRKYAKRYGADVERVVQLHLQNQHIEKLDHGAERSRRFRNALLAVSK